MLVENQYPRLNKEMRNMMEPMSSIVSFIKYKFMMTTITVTLINGEELTGKVVDAFDNLIGIDVEACVIFINANQIITFKQK